MFCYQCQETAKNQGCTVKGVCGKNDEVANLQDLLVCILRGVSLFDQKAKDLGIDRQGFGRLLTEGLFTTITNVSFDAASIAVMIKKALAARDELKALVTAKDPNVAAECTHICATLTGEESSFAEMGTKVGVLASENEDVRSLRELLVYGLKGIAAYADHAAVLGKEDQTIYDFISEALASTTKDLNLDEMVGLVLRAGEIAVTTMALLDSTNTDAYGNPEITKVNINIRTNPSILISSHDLKNLEKLLEQTKGTGIDVYTHGEMLPAHSYPAFKKYDNFVGNYGGAWYEQRSQFESFNGPILMTTNCIVPPSDTYRDRIFTTGLVAFEGVKHIPDREGNSSKDFSALIEMAKFCAAPVEIETGKIIGGFAHHQVFELADKVVAAVKSGAIKKFVVMAGCDGRHKSRAYFTEVAKALPKDTIILTAGCAKYRYNKLDLGDIGGIPRVLDAGQCNDSYSLAVIALKLKEVFALEDINDLPIEFDIAWYEQKAVTVLLALLHLGVKGIRLGPTLPAFLSPNVVKVLVDAFDIKPTGEVADDVAAMMA
ncbi:hydroxylamine reductase [bacterium]|nr:hydroxylamine reductase [bacterium]